MAALLSRVEAAKIYKMTLPNDKAQPRRACLTVGCSIVFCRNTCLLSRMKPLWSLALYECREGKRGEGDEIQSSAGRVRKLPLPTKLLPAFRHVRPVVSLLIRVNKKNANRLSAIQSEAVNTR
jgi:hypothetical protein